MGLGSFITDIFGSDVDVPNAAEVSAQQRQDNIAAQTDNLNYNNIDRFGVGGATTFQRDAQGRPIGMTSTLDPRLGWDSGAGNMGLLMGQLPGTTIDYSGAGITPGQIAQRNFDAYAANTDRMRGRQYGNIMQTLAERGLTPDGEIGSNMLQDWMQQNNIADLNAAAAAHNASVPMAAQMTDTAFKQGMTGFNMAGANLGLLQNMAGFAPNNQFTGSQMSPVNSAQNTWNAYNAEVANEQNAWGNFGNLVGAGVGLMTGGFNPAKMFGGGSSTTPGTQANGGWSTTTKPAGQGLFGGWFS